MGGLDQTPTRHAPVLIVGSSMIGMTLSALLAQQGVRGCITVEKHASTAIHPRAALFHPRTMQIYREMGVQEKMTKASEEHYDIHAGVVEVESLIGRQLQAWMLDMNDGVENVSPANRIFLTQKMFEPMLRDLSTSNGAHLKFSTELVDFKQDSEGVTALIRDLDTKKEEVIRSQYMVACDGNRSPVRNKLGIDFAGHGLLSRSITIYFKMKPEDLAKTKYNGVIYINNEKVRGFFRLDKTGDDCFFIVFAAGDRGKEESRFPADVMTNEWATDLLKLGIGADFEFDIDQIIPWDAMCSTAQEFNKGRVLLAGDAAHVVTPHGGYGGNTGIQDAHNLAWKLALVLKGVAHPDLVEKTYHEERFPVCERTVNKVYSHYIKRTAPELRDPENDVTKDTMPDAWLELGYRYHSKALATSELGPITEDPLTAKSRPGSIAHHQIVNVPNKKNIALADLFGHTKGFTLLTGPNGHKWHAAVYQQDVDNLPKITTETVLSGAESETAFLDKYDISSTGAVLIRPDGIVAWSRFDDSEQGKSLEKELADVFRNLLCFEDESSSLGQRLKESLHISAPTAAKPIMV